ncbi:hypothetical protein CYMTET_21025 [Cymbomonas tetramitiformis]|uniref:Uncharacterized protein n=1 Tax=Cymbomonas tetramitiformis TaxID=36881 RepID=A0AAE0G2Z5_9CHLO|nr:hypothetical protein CYMTET_21025 [Cymbomonas tetramitiformis]|eukprot:gene13723-16216_t
MGEDEIVQGLMSYLQFLRASEEGGRGTKYASQEALFTDNKMAKRERKKHDSSKLRNRGHATPHERAVRSALNKCVGACLLATWIKQLRPEASSIQPQQEETILGERCGGIPLQTHSRWGEGSGASKSPSKAKKLTYAKEATEDRKIAADHLELASRHPVGTEVWVFARQTDEDDALTVLLKDDE